MKKSGKTMLAILAIAVAGGAAYAAGGDGKGTRGGWMTGMFERFDADGDGSVTRAEADAAHAASFAAADTDGDGSVNLEELTAALAARAAEQAERMMKRADANSDGMIGADEMGQGRRHGAMFERLDADGDGVITKAEAEEMRHGRRDGHREHRGERRRHGDHGGWRDGRHDEYRDGYREGYRDGRHDAYRGHHDG
jgi:Ca2+-binding EF-hand superfamily protein